MSRDHHNHHHHHHDAHQVRAQPVLLDLGDGIGALIVHTDPELLGAEVEISPSGEDGDRQHKEVLQRALGRTTATVLVTTTSQATTPRSTARRRGPAAFSTAPVAELDWHATRWPPGLAGPVPAGVAQWPPAPAGLVVSRGERNSSNARRR
jgi:hypothetical protein